ncbi:DUF2026 family protein [Hydrogenophaga sp.]|jgi:hypothetical protein|uniref:DUF2026 family protein n=1 Tax=Hydrogenophaga sp. TaxID=1904254 RepID=UPI000BD8890C|nr:DUF2026 family protein [Hydrogenophaga sp.]MDP1958994.1 DUF2026 family protein [Methylotenera sp.]MDP3885448.1 DUF2026 family protein [Hydrogenophaga sp.]OYZ38948.1 MAG: hypothetical protein B7Y16_10135 [Methylotenera sp. 24-45-7]
MKAIKLEINLPEYEKIFRILHGVSAYANKGHPPSCQFYNVTGAYILSKLYGIDARPMMGAAFIAYSYPKEPLITVAKKPPKIV